MTSLYNIIEIPEKIIKEIKTIGSLSKSVESEVLNLEQTFKPFLVNSVFELQKEHQIRIFIHNCQHRLILLSNEIYYNLSDHSSNQQKKTDTKCMLILDDLLEYIKTSFPDYFNYLELIPLKLNHVKKRQFKSDLGLISEKFQSALIRVVLEPIYDIIDNDSQFTYHQLAYFENIMKVLASFKFQESETEFLKRTLIFYNYNSLPVSHFLIKSISEEIQEVVNLKQQIHILTFHQKELNQMLIGTMILNPGVNSLNITLSKWLSEEITFLEKQIRDQEHPEKNLFKLITDLSVAQLAFIIRLLIDFGIIKNKNQKAVVQFFALHTKTKDCEEISTSSLLNKFYSPKSNIIEDVKGILFRLINQIQKF